jgi:hypothetical protein
MRLTWKRQQQTTHAINSEASIETTGFPVHSGRNKAGQQVFRSTGHSFTHKNNKGRQLISLASGRKFTVSFLAFHQQLHCKKELAIFPSPAWMSLTKLSLGGKKLNNSRPGRV